MSAKITLAILVGCTLAACGKPAQDLAWKQDVPLHDGRVIVLERLSHIGAEALLMNRLRMETRQVLGFAHPDTGRYIQWAVPKGLLPFMLDFEKGTPYYVLTEHTVADYNDWECPNPPYVVFKLAGGHWQRVPFEELPERFVTRNLLAMAKGQERYIVNGHVTREALERFLLNSPPERRVINRNTINPIARGCHGDNLARQGRHSEIDYRR